MDISTHISWYSQTRKCTNKNNQIIPTTDQTAPPSQIRLAQTKIMIIQTIWQGKE